MKQYIVDAFTDRLFSGNQAAVCVTDRWPEDSLMQQIAVENHFSETAFAVREGDKWRLRWFAPSGEVDFCGHATLGAAYALFRFHCPTQERIEFLTKAGPLTVQRSAEGIEMDLPAYHPRRVPLTPMMEEALGVRPLEAWLDRDLMLVLEEEAQVRALSPDQEKIRALEGLLVIATAPGRDCTAVSRVFAPRLRIPEDPVTGSAHCMIAPYWSGKTGQKSMLFRQASQRGGTLRALALGERVRITGQAVLFSVSELAVPFPGEGSV